VDHAGLLTYVKQQVTGSVHSFGHPQVRIVGVRPDVRRGQGQTVRSRPLPGVAFRCADRRRFTDRRKIIVEFYLNLAAALTVIRRLINRARTTHRWPTRPTTRRLR
jgi:hypothetical protein